MTSNEVVKNTDRVRIRKYDLLAKKERSDVKRVLPRCLSCFIALFLALSLHHKANASHQRGRLGIGFTNQLITGIPALSFKLQKSSTFALGGFVALSTNETSGGHGAGIKVYRLIFEEPQLNFYGSFLAGLLGQKSGTTTQSGFQFDFNLGSEFHLKGLKAWASPLSLACPSIS